MLAALLDAVSKRPTLLLVSKDHMQDVVPKSDEPTVARFCAAVERFPFRAVVDKEPWQLEPWTNGAADIGLRPIADFSRLMTQPTARPYLAELSAAQSRLYDAFSVSQSERRSVLPISRKGNELRFQCLITLIRGWIGTDVSEILGMWETESGRRLDADERTAIVKILAPWATLLQEHEKQYSLSDQDRENLLLHLLDGADDTSHVHSPGMFLARRLARCHQMNLGRNPIPSDSVDRMHASFFPYVDVATCDAGAFACLEPHLKVVKGIRTPRVFKNSDLASTTEAIRSWRASNDAESRPT